MIKVLRLQITAFFPPKKNYRFMASFFVKIKVIFNSPD